MFKSSGCVSIRDFTVADIENKVKWINDPQNNTYLHYDLPLDAERTKEWFYHKNNEIRQDCVIEYNQNPVGLIGLLSIDRNSKKAEYYISMGDSQYKNRGIATTASLLLLEYAFDDLLLNKVYLNVDSDNVISCHLYEKIGFCCEGIFRKEMLHRGQLIDRKHYAVLREEYRKKQIKTPTELNVLILSAGTRNKIVQYFKRALNGAGRVIATDMSELAPALYDADKYYIVPRMTDPDYLNVILDICRKEKITGILSLIDPELSLLAAHTADFKALGTTVIGSPYELCEMSLDKYRMFRWLSEHGYRCAESYMDRKLFYADVDAGKLGYPVFVKPAKGSASISISKATDKETVDLLFEHEDGLMIQEYINGQEIGADVYIDMISGEVVSIFTKKKIKMRAGETDKAVSFKDKKLFDLIEKFAKESGYRGQIDIDIFDIDGEYYISEVNPRFGGGYPHAYECGCDHMKMILENLTGRANTRQIGEYQEGIYMMKYNEIAVLGR